MALIQQLRAMWLYWRGRVALRKVEYICDELWWIAHSTDSEDVYTLARMALVKLGEDEHDEELDSSAAGKW